LTAEQTSAAVVEPIRLLVVEDDDTIRHLMVASLSDAGFEVDEAVTADEAIPLTEAEGYQLIVTDLNMPGQLNGMDIAIKVHDLAPTVTVGKLKHQGASRGDLRWHR